MGDGVVCNSNFEGKVKYPVILSSMWKILILKSLLLTVGRWIAGIFNYGHLGKENLHFSPNAP